MNSCMVVDALNRLYSDVFSHTDINALRMRMSINHFGGSHARISELWCIKFLMIAAFCVSSRSLLFAKVLI